MQNLFFVHAALMALAAIFLITGVITARAKKRLWLKRHKTLVLLGVATAFVGGAVIFFAKAAMQFPHFQSPHSIAGLVTLILLVATPIVGASIAHGPQRLRMVHKILGRITLSAVLVAASAGIFRIIQIFKS